MTAVANDYGRTFRLVRSVNGIGSSTISFREKLIENVVFCGPGGIQFF